MYRLLFSELSQRIDRQLDIKIEMIARILCELPMDNLDVPTIRALCTLPLDGYFVENAKQLFSNVCPICSDTFPRSQMETMFLCGHMCCLDCLKGYYRSIIPAIQDRRSLNQLTCFQEAHEITAENKLYFFQSLESKVSKRERETRLWSSKMRCFLDSSAESMVSRRTNFDRIVSQQDLSCHARSRD